MWRRDLQGYRNGNANASKVRIRMRIIPAGMIVSSRRAFLYCNGVDVVSPYARIDIPKSEMDLLCRSQHGCLDPGKVKAEAAITGFRISWTLPAIETPVNESPVT